jgi:hypothetical protein
MIVIKIARCDRVPHPPAHVIAIPRREIGRSGATPMLSDILKGLASNINVLRLAEDCR